MGTRSSCVAWGAALAALSFFSLAGSSALAQPPTEAEIPPALRPWAAWALADHPTYGCTSAESAAGDGGGGDPICVWPASLRVEIVQGGATFAMDVTLDRGYGLTLPGSGRVWPLDVRIDGRAAPVVSDADRPMVFLEAGAHRVEGRLSWATAPDTLDVPPDVARVVVVQGGVARPATRDTDGAVWLRAQSDEAAAAEEADSVSLEVYRQITDGVPLTVVTRISVHVAGHPRELRLGAVLPAGAVPTEVTADLATRVTASGELTLQLHAGTYAVQICSLLAHPDAPLAMPQLGPPWPPQEVWTWVPSESFRQVEVTGANSIDPARTTLPDEWRTQSAYLIEPSTSVTLTSVRRGEPAPPPNELGLTRSIWLDDDGGGASVSDTLALEMHDGFRIDLMQGELGRVSILGQDQLITRAIDDGPAGVELRDTSSNVSAEWRLDAAPTDLAAVGWSEDAQSVVTTLHVGPGWQLVHASGVDRAPESWTEQWTLLGFFALLLVTVVIGRVFGLPWGVAAFVGVGLAYHAPDAPRWIWVALAVTLALHRALGERASAAWVRRFYTVLLVITCVIVVVFAAQETRVALHPSLDPEAAGASIVLGEPPEAQEEGMMGSGAARGDYGSVFGSGSYGISSDVAPARPASSAYGWMDASAVVQTGFGCPTWTWRSYELAFDGPVSRDHHMRVWLSPPWLTSLLGLLRAGLMLALCYAAIRFRPQAPIVPATTTPAVVALVLLALALVPSVGTAQATPPAGPIPSPELLAELETRLLQTPACGDTCAVGDRMRISAHGDVLTIDLDVGATAQAAYPIPGPVDTWSPDTVMLDGQPARSLVRLDSGFIHVRVTAGAHAIHIEGSLAGHDAVTLALGRAPRTIEIVTDGWESDGSGTGPHVPESIQLRRTVPSTASASDAAPQDDATMHAALPSWLMLERRLEIGVRWTLRSTLTRRSPATTADVARIPLLPGESVTDASVVVDAGTAVVTLGQHDENVQWTSVLTPSAELALHAPDTGHLTETWTVACTPLWHCATAGVTPTQSASTTTWEPRFDPWPGESLTITLTRPAAVDGQSTTIDSASLAVHPGTRLAASTLRLHVRTSVSAPVAISLPAEADVRTLTVDNQPRPIQRTDGTLTVTLQPGAHDVLVEWQEGDGWTSVMSTPHVTVNGSIVNLTLDVDVTSDRWLLWIAGPPWGPAVLLWPYVIVIVIVAYALSRRRELLPTLADWILLGLGLTQVPWAMALFVIGWFFAIEWRRSTPIASQPLFDLRQVVVGGYTFFAGLTLIGVISDGLLGTPGMDVQGPGSSADHLHFFVDRSTGALPEATILTLPVFVFRVLMFLWAGWLALAVVRWVRRAWVVFGEGGLWRVVQMPAPLAPPMGMAAQHAAPAATPIALESPTEGEEPDEGEKPTS
jgi:hypothetical protein